MLTMSSRWNRRPDGANWGDFGQDDELGRLNLLTPDTRKRAAGYVQEGLTFCLSLPLTLPGGTAVHRLRHPPRLAALLRDQGGALNYNYPLARENPCATDIVSDDIVTLATQYSTHWDTFAHVGQSAPAATSLRRTRRAELRARFGWGSTRWPKPASKGVASSSICVATLAAAGAWLAMTISCEYSRRIALWWSGETWFVSTPASVM